jgi:hypothetical protein
MHGQARTVERKIRLWVVQQERNRRKEGELGLIGARSGAADGTHVQLAPARSRAKRK